MQVQRRDHREDVLLGVLSVQLGMVEPRHVMAAERTLAQNHDDAPGTLADALQRTGALDANHRTLLENVRAQFLATHDGDAGRALEALGDEALAATFGLAATVNDEGKVVALGGVDAIHDPLAPPSDAVAETDNPVVVTREHPGRYTGPRRQGQPPAPEPLELGRGGIGRVLIAHDAHLGREVAVKELLPRDGETKPRSQSNPRNSLAAARFLREARLTGQLEHPNIVPVYELGRRTDGTLYYTMKVVRGRNLATALDATKTLADRLRLLKHVADLTDAIAYAHSRGVIHRDIKPENVMVGEFGETVVLDWGLAKPRDARDLDQSAKAKPRGPGPSGLVVADGGPEDLAKTTDGTLIGTPLFMSPEQAQGDIAAVDERTDVWALGVVLYELLTGVPPFSGSTATELLVNICRAPLIGVRERCPEAPPELAAIAERALKRDRFQRYASAREMAEEIRAYMSGGRVRAYTYRTWELLRRWAARHKAVLAVAAVATCALIALGIWSFVQITSERDLARDAAAQTELARQRAVASETAARTTRDNAERLVRYMLGDLKERLEPLGQIALLDGVASAAQAYYAGDPTSGPSAATGAAATAGPDLNRLRNRAGVLALVADLARMKGDLKTANAEMTEAETLREALLGTHPDDLELLADRAESHRQRGLLLRMQGDLTGAKTSLMAALAARETILAKAPTTPNAARNVVESELDLGDIATLTGDLTAAEAAYEKAVQHAEAAVAAADPNAQPTLSMRFTLTVARDALGTARLDHGNVDGAEAAFKSALAERKTLVAAAPGNIAWKHRLSVSHARLAEVAHARGDEVEARSAWQHSLEIMEKVARQDPSNARWQRDLAVNWNRLGDLDMQANHPADALASYERAQTYISALNAKDPSDAELERDLEVGTDRVGDAQFALGRLEEARRSFLAALTIADKLAQLDPTNARWQHDLGLALGRAAQIQWRSGDLAGAKPYAERAVQVLTALATKDAQNTTWVADLQAAKDNLVVFSSGDPSQPVDPLGINLQRTEGIRAMGGGRVLTPNVPAQRPAPAPTPASEQRPGERSDDKAEPAETHGARLPPQSPQAVTPPQLRPADTHKAKPQKEP